MSFLPGATGPEPAWAELKQRYAKSPVEFNWAIALIDESGMPKSRQQEDWFYRRSGTIMRSPFMLNSGWMTGLKEYLAPELRGGSGQGLWRHGRPGAAGLMEAAMCAGKKVGDWDVSVAVAA